MKTVNLLSVLTLAILVGCGEEVNELSQKKETLKELKQQMGDLKSQISSLEKETYTPYCKIIAIINIQKL